MARNEARPAPPKPPSGTPSLAPASGRQDVATFVSTHTAPWTVAFAQGAKWATVNVASIATDRGADIAELHYTDGRHVTVRVETQLAWVAEGGA